jgi:transposase
MLSEPQRQTILQLKAKGVSIHAIARLLGHTRRTVRRVLKTGPTPARRAPASAGPSPAIASMLPTLYCESQGNVVRMQQLLAERHDQTIPYSTLTYWVRQAELGAPPVRVGHYNFAPGEEMQHDTSPHRLELEGRAITAQCAGLILGFSRYAFVQYYPRFTRFEAEVFLTAAFEFLGGTCARCTIDNTSVLVIGGSGAEALIAAAIEQLGLRFGVRFIPHAVRHPDRKGHIERLFHYVEHNFLPGRTFGDWVDVNAQARDWCEQVANQKIKRSLGTSPRAAFEQERAHLRPLPVHRPAPCLIAHRVVDTEGYVRLDTNRYSVPERLLGKAVDVHQTFETVAVYFQGQEVARHARAIGQRDRRISDPGHQGPPRARRSDPPAAQQALLTDAPAVLSAYVRALAAHAPGRGSARLKRLLVLQRTYPAEPFLAAVDQALTYGLYDLNRLESLILKQVRGDFFQIGEDDDA